MSVHDISAIVAAMISRDITTRATGVSPDMLALEALAKKAVKPKGLANIANGTELSMLYSDIWSNITGRDVSIKTVEDIITSDVMTMDIYQRVLWKETKRMSELQADMRLISDTSDLVVDALRPVLEQSSSVDVPEVEVIPVPDLDDRGELGVIHKDTEDQSDEVILTHARNYATMMRAALTKYTLNPELIVALNSITGVSLDVAGTADDTVKYHCLISRNNLARENDAFEKTLSLLQLYKDTNTWVSALTDATFELDVHLGYTDMVSLLKNLSSSLRAVLAYRTRYILSPVNGERPVLSSVYSKRGKYYVYQLTNDAIEHDVVCNYAVSTQINPHGIHTVSLAALDKIAQSGQADQIKSGYRSSQEKLKLSKAAVESTIYAMSKSGLAQYSFDQIQQITDRITTALDGVMSNTLTLDAVVTSALSLASGFTAYQDITQKVNYAMESATRGSATMDTDTLSALGKVSMANALAQVLCSRIAVNF